MLESLGPVTLDSRSPLVTLFLAALAVVSLGQFSQAQLPYARLHWIFPPGGQVGTEFEVTVNGADLDEARKIHFSHPGIQARAKMTEPTAFEPERMPVENVFLVSIGSDVPLGIHEARVVGRYGVSNPRAFVVGTLSETHEASENESAANAMPVSPETTVNGRAQGVNPDFYRLELELGQRVIIDLWGQRIDSQIDATLAICKANGETIAASRDQHFRDPFLDFTAPAAGPYWIKVYDFIYEGGEERFYRLSISGAPFVEYVFPPAVLRGAAAQVTLFGHNLPGASPAENTFLNGTRLERRSVEVFPPDAVDEAVGGKFTTLVKPGDLDARHFIYRLQSDQGMSNPVPISFATAPVVIEQEPNDRADQAHEIEIPCEYVGQFYPNRDDDWIQFAARKGDVLWLEVFSGRLGLTTDAFLLIQRVNTDEAGEVTVTDVAEVDDSPKRPGGSGYGDPTSDPSHLLHVDEDATYRVLVRDLYSNAVSRPQHVYRLSLRRPQPDFRLVAVPHAPWNPDPAQPMRGTPVLRRGGTAGVRVLAIRRDGFDGEIALTVTGLPEGVTCLPETLGPGVSERVLVFSAAEDAPQWGGTIQITGRARIGDGEVLRTASGGTIVWDTPNNEVPANARLTPDLALAVSAEAAPLRVRSAEDKVWETAREAKLSIPLELIRQNDLAEQLELKPLNLPAGVKAEIAVAEDGSKGTLDLTVEASAAPGTYHFVLEGKVKLSYRRNPEAAEKAEANRKSIEEQLAKLNETSKQTAKAQSQFEAAAQESAKAAEEAVARVTEAETQVEAAKQNLAEAKNAVPSATESTERDKSEPLQAAERRLAEATTAFSQAVENREQARRNAADTTRHAAAVAKDQAVKAKAAADAAAQVKAAEEALNRAAERAKKLAEAAKPTDQSMYVASTPIKLKIAEAAKE